jgi:hypothetical protein
MDGSHFLGPFGRQRVGGGIMGVPYGMVKVQMDNNTIIEHVVGAERVSVKAF